MRRLVSPFLVLVCVFVHGCDDGDGGTCACPENLVEWNESTLPAGLDVGGIWQLEGNGTRTVGLATTEQGAWVIERGPSIWNIVGATVLPGTTPVRRDVPVLEPHFASGIAIDGTGTATIVGGKVSVASGETPVSTPVVWVETEAGWDYAAGPQGAGSLNAVVALGAQDIVAAGTGDTGVVVLTGSAHDQSLQFGGISVGPGSGEEGVVDLAVSTGGVYACGFDDGGSGTPTSPNRFVLQYAGSNWSVLESPCGGCTDRDFRAVAATPLSVYVGGAITDYAGGAADPSVAWLAQYTIASGQWTELLLPSAGELDRVNDILVTRDGDVYLACGDGHAAIVHMGLGAEPVIEWTRDGTELFSLAELSDGTIAAGGLIPTSGEDGQPVLFERGQ
jgi:hypothetical protein